MEHSPISLGKMIANHNLGMTVATLVKWFDRNLERLIAEDCVMVMKAEKRITRRVTNEAKFLELIKKGL